MSLSPRGFTVPQSYQTGVDLSVMEGTAPHPTYPHPHPPPHNTMQATVRHASLTEGDQQGCPFPGRRRTALLTPGMPKVVRAVILWSKEPRLGPVRGCRRPAVQEALNTSTSRNRTGQSPRYAHPLVTNSDWSPQQIGKTLYYNSYCCLDILKKKKKAYCRKRETFKN